MTVNTIFAWLILAIGLTSVFAQASAETAGSDGQSCSLPPMDISAEFPFDSRFVTVRDSFMHYVERGEGDPILFIHGNPTSSYLWRNILPYVDGFGRVIAIDLIGMGRSGKPDIDYTLASHYAYVESFIETLGLKNITLVLHDWGGALGFEYARRNPGKVKAIAFMEAAVPPAMPVPSLETMGEIGEVFAALRTPGVGEHMVLENNFFVEVMIPNLVNRTLTDTEMMRYRAPYLTPASRLPTLVWPRELPIAGDPPEVVETMVRIERFMRRTPLPMLLIYASPGALLPPQLLPWFIENIKEIETAYVGQGLHYIQEDQPQAIGRALADWMRRKLNDNDD